MEPAEAREAYSFEGAVLTAIANGIDVTKYNFRRKNRAGQGGPWRMLFSAPLIRSNAVYQNPQSGKSS